MLTVTTPPVARIRLPGRTTLEVVESGDPGGTPVVLLHGITDPWRSWELALPDLPLGLRAIAVSQQGHGGSGRPVGGDRTRDVGHSMGTWTPPSYARSRPGARPGRSHPGSSRPTGHTPPWEEPERLAREPAAFTSAAGAAPRPPRRA